MPICTTCTYPTPYLYTVYPSAHNLRLEQCKNCQAFADPYVEHDVLTLALDLLLLKRDVFRHLLFNRGGGARQATETPTRDEDEDPSGKIKGTPKQRDDIAEQVRSVRRWTIIVQLGAALIFVDAFIRWSHLNPLNAGELPSESALKTWPRERIVVFMRILVGSVIETLAFHAGVVMSCYIVLRLVRIFESLRANAATSPSGIREQFRISHIPLTILYSSLTKLFLLFLLSIWRSDSTEPGMSQTQPYRMDTSNMNPLFAGALELLDEDNMDREWIVRNVLGGMSAGFGLRVVLDCHPIFTTIIVLMGWAVKTLVSTLVSSWVGGDEKVGEAWLAYSIP